MQNLRVWHLLVANFRLCMHVCLWVRACLCVHAFKKTLSMCLVCVLGRSEHLSAHSNHGNTAWAGQHGSSYSECRRLPPAPEPPALPDISTSHSLSGTQRLSDLNRNNHLGLIDYCVFNLTNYGVVDFLYEVIFVAFKYLSGMFFSIGRCEIIMN